MKELLITLTIALCLLIPAMLMSSWILMLCLGALAHIFGWANLAIGFWPAVVVNIILGIIFGSVSYE
jgi:hypothetical protein